MKPVLSSLVVGAALAGIVTCAAAQSGRPAPGEPGQKCNSGICKIEVTVNDCGAAGGITVNPQLLSMSAKGSSTTIHWTIVTPGYEFAKGGIRFEPAAPQFRQLPGGPANVIKMHNDKTQQGDFYYFVDVLNCVPVDPWIRNDP